MNTPYFFCFSLLLITICSVSAATDPYDFLQLTLQWQPALCSRPFVRCKKTPYQEFTIHGLWPTNLTGAQPRDCFVPGKSAVFHEILIRPYRKKLEKYWPDVEHDTDLRFWESQWMTHGTCSESLVDSKRYFREPGDKMMKWEGDKLDILTILKEEGYRPNNRPVELAKVEEAIKQSQVISDSGGDSVSKSWCSLIDDPCLIDQVLLYKSSLFSINGGRTLAG